MTVIGASLLATSTPCLTVKTDVNPDGTALLLAVPTNVANGAKPKYRCCYR
jgi:hypothetical protein